MEKRHFLADYVEGEPGFRAEPWYNPHGDCLVFKSEEVAVVAHRVDEILTVYESAETGKTIGFQIKGIGHLLKQFRCDGLAVGTLAQPDGDIIEISLVAILMQAYRDGPNTIERRVTYVDLAERFANQRVDISARELV